MKPSFFTTIAIFFCCLLNAQTIESSSGIDKNYFQIELESLYSEQKEGSDFMKSWSIPSVLLRYGLFKGVELQLNTPIIKEKLYENDHLVHSLHKFDDSQFGISVDLWKQYKILPEAALMARAILPTKLNLGKEHIGKVVSLNLSNQLNEKFTFSYNIGFVNETSNTNTGFYIANLNFDLNSKIHFFLEEFSDFNKHQNITHNLNTGFGYLFNDNFCVDLSIAKGINHHMFYVGGILTWRFKTT